MISHRLVPAQGAFPAPGEDATRAPWFAQLGSSDVAMLCYDAATGKPVTISGKRPETPVLEYAIVYPRRYMADVVMRGLVARNPQLRVCLYDRRGRMLADAVRHAVHERQLPLGIPRYAVHFIVTAVAGTIGLVLGSYAYVSRFGGSPLRWDSLAPAERVAVVGAGVLLGSMAALFFSRLRLELMARRAKPALAPFGSPEREQLYQQLAKRPFTLLPSEITLEPAAAVWDDLARYQTWSHDLTQAGCTRAGTYHIPQLDVYVDFWVDAGDDLTITIINHPKAGMWLSATTRYEDGTSWSVANRASPGVDQNPRARTEYLGADATVADVLARARGGRPSGERRAPSPDTLVDDYRAAWRDSVRWRRERGITPDEYRRADERRQAASKTDAA